MYIINISYGGCCGASRATRQSYVVVRLRSVC